MNQYYLKMPNIVLYFSIFLEWLFQLTCFSYLEIVKLFQNYMCTLLKVRDNILKIKTGSHSTGLQKGGLGLEKGLTLGLWALPSTFATSMRKTGKKVPKIVATNAVASWASKSRTDWNANLGLCKNQKSFFLILSRVNPACIFYVDFRNINFFIIGCHLPCPLFSLNWLLTPL